jgi:RNA polymerase sigma factor (sigma-70 family)
VSVIEDKFLLWKLKGGDVDALRRVYEKYKGPMVSVALGMTGDMARSEDAMQDAFVSFAEKAAAGAVRSNLKAYLMTSVINNVRKEFRKKSSTETALEGIDVPSERRTGAEEAVRLEDRERLKAAMTLLPQEQREAIMLRIHGQMSFDQVAAAQGSNANTARTRYRRGIENLRNLMDDEAGRADEIRISKSETRNKAQNPNT